MYDSPLDCQVTARYGVLNCRNWSAPIGCTGKLIPIKIITFVECHMQSYRGADQAYVVLR